MFNLGKSSKKILSTVHPDLQKVVNLAIIITKVDFAVVQGLRTHEQQSALYGKGRTAEELKNAGVDPKYAAPSEKKVTWTMKSNHLSGRAVDLAPYVNGKIEWDDSNKLGVWDKISQAMKQAADRLGIGITWGGDWKTSIDRPHFELKS